MTESRFPELTPEERAQLERFLPIRISLRPTADGKWEGVTELSFAMAWSRERANIWWSGKAYSMLGEHMLNAIEDTTNNTSTLGGQIFDPLDPACPVEINWSHWLKALKGSSRFAKRNAPFAVKESP